MADFYFKAEPPIPDCRKCKWHYEWKNDYRIGCTNHDANITSSERTILMDRFDWPDIFDPTCLKSCDGFEAKNKCEQITT